MPENKQWTDLRMFYTKTGLLKYISHLDTVRCITRAMKRADIPVWFTQGFNPRAFLTFAMPLSLGFESYCETVDFRITEDVDLTELQNRLNAVMPSGMEIKKIDFPKMSADKICWAEYKIIFNNPESSLSDNIEKVLSGNEIIVSKKVKKGRNKVVKQVNIKENIKSFAIENDGTAITLNIILSSGINANINPMLLVNALNEMCNSSCDDVDYIKLQSYTSDMEVFA